MKQIFILREKSVQKMNKKIVQYLVTSQIILLWKTFISKMTVMERPKTQTRMGMMSEISLLNEKWLTGVSKVIKTLYFYVKCLMLHKNLIHVFN